MSTYEEDAAELIPDIGLDETVTDLDIAVLLVLHPEGFNYEAQLLAIRELLSRNKDADQLLQDKIRKIYESAKKAESVLYSYDALRQWQDHEHMSVYQDAAHSMAAAGMLAPFVESIFYLSFYSIRHILNVDTAQVGSHERWRYSSKHEWDCHFVFGPQGYRKSFIKGVMQMATAIGLHDYLPRDLRPTLEALFEYRNKVFHLGFEWPDDVCLEFDKRINTGNGWQSN